MKPYLALTRHLIQSQFCAAQTWAFLGVSWAFLAYIFALVIEQSQAATLGPVVWWSAFLALFQAPLLCMGFFSKEDRNDFTLLLRTLRLNAHALVWLPFGQRFLLLLIVDSILVLQYGYLQHWGNPDPSLHGSGILGLVLLQANYLAVSMLMASLTRSSIKACLASIGLLLFSWLLYYGDLLFAGKLSLMGAILKECSIYKHFFSFLGGGFYLHDIGALLFLIVLALYLAGLSLKR